jgi:hypothetical protein
MNIDNINKLIGVLKATETFDMRSYYHDDAAPGCGTPACIGGHAQALAGTSTPDHPFQTVVDAQEFLDITPEQGSDLFILGGWGVPNEQKRLKVQNYGLNKVTREQAVRVLELLRDTGRVRWDMALFPKDFE